MNMCAKHGRGTSHDRKSIFDAAFKLKVVSNPKLLRNEMNSTRGY